MHQSSLQEWSLVLLHQCEPYLVMCLSVFHVLTHLSEFHVVVLMESDSPES